MNLNDGRVVSNFILQSIQKQNITVSRKLNNWFTNIYFFWPSHYITKIYGKGDQTRSFQYVSDLVDGLIRLMNSNYSKPVNIGNPDEYSIKELATKIRDMIG